ncbi:MAG: ubiquinone biosynthesis protein [Phenylobacterium zucineum]|nr:MAG: ubiquinone biosynthesis protein [Phenylobacterium zucineum]
MTADIISMPALKPKAIQPPKLEWGRALAALRRLLSNKEDTTAVFEIMRALNGETIKKGYDRLLSVPDGGRMAYEAVELAPKLMNEAWLDSFAPGTVGAAYREFVRSENLSAEGLAEVSRSVGDDIEVKHPYAWFGRRNRDVHDLWHVLSGYHRDALGEACLVAFSYAQTKGLGWALIAIGAALRSRKGGYPYPKAIWQGYQRGKAATWLLGEDYERLMAEPLEAARKRLNITPATLYNAIPPEARDTVLPETKIAA